jgi:hypothetical protein
MKMKTIYGFKRRPSVKSNDDPVPSQDQGVLDEPKNLDYLQKFLLRVVAT